MCPIVTAIDKMIQVYSIYIIYIVYMLNLTDYVHHLCVYKWIVEFVFSQRTTEQL